MKRYPDGIAGQALLPEGRARAHAGLDPDACAFEVSTRDDAAAAADDPLPARQRRAGAALDGEHGLHRPEHVVLAGRPARSGRTSCSSTSTRPPTSASPRSSQVALLVKEVLDALGLAGFAKTSGGDGHARARADRAAAHVRRHARVRRDRRRRARPTHRGLVTTEWTKAKRRGVLIDANQNGEGKTIASAYSVRPQPGAPVSTPLRWEEVDDGLDPAAFTMDAVLAPGRAARRPVRRRPHREAVARQGPRRRPLGRPDVLVDPEDVVRVVPPP